MDTKLHFLLEARFLDQRFGQSDAAGIADADEDGRMDVLFKDRVLPYTTVRKLPRAIDIEDEKTIDACLDQIIARSHRRAPRPGSVDGSGRAEPDPPTAPTT